MNAGLGTELEGNVPKRALNEWDSGNNRIYHIRATYEREFLRLAEGQPDENVKTYIDFLKRRKFEGISVVRRLNYIRALQVLKRVKGDKTLSGLCKSDIDAFLEAVSKHSPATTKMRFYCLKTFLKFIGRQELLDGIKPPSEGEIKVRASDLLTREDIQKLIDACCTTRGRAFVSMLYESGARIGEILNVEVKDFEFDANGVRVYLNGKTGRRRIRLVESARYLREWFKEIREAHPKTPYVWFGENENEPSQYATTVKFIRKTARLAGLRKKIYPHLFRHSRASELAQKLKESQLRAFMGWGAASDMPQVYIHLSAQDMDKAILELYKTENSKPGTEDCAQHSDLDEIRKFYEMWKQFKALG